MSATTPLCVTAGMFLEQSRLLVANDFSQAVENGQWEYATNLWGRTEQVIMQVADGVDFYNILKKERLPLYYANTKEWKALEVPHDPIFPFSLTS